MAWRVHLETDPLTVQTLQEQFTGPDLFIGTEDDGTVFASGTRFEDCEDAEAARFLARQVASEMTAVARLIDSGCTPVTHMDRVRDERRGGISTVFAEVTMRSRSRLTVGSPTPPIAGEVMKHASSDSDYAAALALLGEPRDLDADLLYKVFELLRKSAGGSNVAFLQRSTWSAKELSTFTGTLNHPEVLGAAARHAVLSGGKPRDSWTLEDCARRITDVVRRWPDAAVK